MGEVEHSEQAAGSDRKAWATPTVIVETAMRDTESDISRGADFTSGTAFGS